MTDSNVSQTGLATFRSVRISSNFRHSTINPPLNSALEMAKPEFDVGGGYFSPKGNDNSKFSGTSDGFTDYNYEDCTNKTKKWKFKYLMGESEAFSGNDKPLEWSRSNWSINDTNKNNKISSQGINAKTLFNNGRGIQYGSVKFRAYQRQDNNVSNRFMWGVMEGAKFGKDSYTTIDSDKISHHIRASAITFRYECHFNEDKKSLLPSLNNQHGGNPIEAFCLAYVKSGDAKIYLAECITVTKDWSQSGTPDWPTKSGSYWIANNKIREYNLTTHSRGGKIWEEHGPKGNSTWNPRVQGVATLTISKNAANKVWDEKMICVGFIATSVHSSRQSGYVGSSMWLDMWDVKLLEMEYKGQCNFDSAGGEEDRKFVRIFRPGDHINEAVEYYRNPGNMFTMDLV
jgi:hypothetical protein